MENDGFFTWYFCKRNGRRRYLSHFVIEERKRPSKTTYCDTFFVLYRLKSAARLFTARIAFCYFLFFWYLFGSSVFEF